MPAWFRSSPGLYLMLTVILLMFAVPIALYALGYFHGGDAHLPVCGRSLC